MTTITEAEIRLQLQLQEMKTSLNNLANENARLRVERDIARSQIKSLLPRATPEEEEEFRQQLEEATWTPFEDIMKEIGLDGSGLNAA